MKQTTRFVIDIDHDVALPEGKAMAACFATLINLLPQIVAVRIGHQTDARKPLNVHRPNDDIKMVIVPKPKGIIRIDKDGEEQGIERMLEDI